MTYVSILYRFLTTTNPKGISGRYPLNKRNPNHPSEVIKHLPLNLANMPDFCPELAGF
jgi:hypothetical protein